MSAPEQSGGWSPDEIVASLQHIEKVLAIMATQENDVYPPYMALQLTRLEQQIAELRKLWLAV